MPYVLFIYLHEKYAPDKELHFFCTFTARRSIGVCRKKSTNAGFDDQNSNARQNTLTSVYSIHFSFLIYSFGVCNGHLADIYRSHSPFHCITPAPISRSQTHRSIFFFIHIFAYTLSNQLRMRLLDIRI